MKQRRKSGKATGSTKAAQFLMVVGEDQAAAILKQLSSDQVQKIGMEMKDLEVMNTQDVNQILASFLEEFNSDTTISVQSDRYTKSVLSQALGEESAESLFDKIMLGGNTRGLDALKWMEPQLVYGIIEKEHPQVQAIVLSHLSSELAGEVLATMPEDQVPELLLRLEDMEPVDPFALEELNSSLEKQVEGVVSKQTSSMGGTKAVADIFNSLEKNTGESLLQKISEVSPEAAERIQDQMFVFEDLTGIPDKDFQVLLREIASDRLALALKGADATLEDKVIRNMSSRAAEMFKDDIETLGAVKISDVQEAQREILKIAKDQANAGNIVLGADSGGMID